jgi:hypothetical protein
MACVARKRDDERVAGIVDRLTTHPWCTREKLAETRATSVKATLGDDRIDAVLAPAASEPGVAALLVYLGWGASGPEA